MNYKHFNNIPINKDEISQAELNIEEKYKSNTFTWNGQFSPQFVESVLNKYANAGMTILDPFVGSGTSLMVACSMNVDVCGIELNPAAFYLSSMYLLCNLGMDERTRICSTIEALYIKNWELTVIVDNEDIISKILVVLNLLNKKSGKTIYEDWIKVKHIIMTLPESYNNIEVIRADSRNVVLEKNKYDLIFTSPPYINVYNYHQQYRSGVEDLGINVLDIAVSEIGSNRKNRSNRFISVVQYCLDMTIMLSNILPSMKCQSRMIWVIGRSSKVLGVSFSNSFLLYNIIVRIFRCRCILKQERSFKNKYGKIIYEDILHFQCNKQNLHQETEYYLKYAKKIVKEYIAEILNNMNIENEKYHMLKTVFDDIDNIQPSPNVKDKKTNF